MLQKLNRIQKGDDINMLKRNCQCSRYNEYKENYIKEYWDRSMGKNDITLEEMEQMITQGAVIVDIRSPQEYREGHINGAINIPEYEIRRYANKIIQNKNQAIIVYCGTGIRSKNALKILQRMGYTNVYNLYKGTENY